MKKTVAFILSVIVLFASGTAWAFDDSDAFADIEAQYGIESQVATSFLEDCAYEMFMYEARNLEEKTVQALPDDVLRVASESFASAFSGEEQSFGYRKAVPSNTQVDLKASTDFVLDKVSYFKAFREDQCIYRENFKTQYTVTKVLHEGNYSVVYINEFISFKYIDHDIPSAVSTDYKVYLYLYDGEWLIADVVSDSDFDKNYRTTGFDKQEAIDEYYYAKENQSSGIGQVVIDAEEELNSINSSVNTILSYNRANARAYAYTYTSQQENDPQHTFYNSLFTSWASSGDCQNFASQCIWAGFGGSNDAASIDSQGIPMDNVGTTPSTNWSSKLKFNTWISVSGFYNYIKNNKATDTRLTASVIDFTSEDQVISGVVAGDIMHVYNSATKLKYDHAIVVTNVTSTNRNGIYFCAHTTDRKELRLSDFYPIGLNGEVRLIKPVSFIIVADCPNGNHTYSLPQTVT